LSNEIEHVTFHLGDTLSINYGETLFDKEDNLSIKFENLISDGRCPIDVICNWEGDADIELKFINYSNVTSFSLHTAKSYFSANTTIDVYNIELIDLLPYPYSKFQIPISEYSAKIVIKRNF